MVIVLKKISHSFFFPPQLQLAVEREGRRVLEVYAGIVFLCEKSPHERWQPGKLHRELCGDGIAGFTFVPANIMSAGADARGKNIRFDILSHGFSIITQKTVNNTCYKNIR
ncbi:hypothetical protein PoB_004748200 [Plakobranchus ocellatus]|uniref:Uncharacterized protein n=1 Tax=Plakobranchus ocellatus TaxID=259542 RepID=A0AAV4BNP0_9GAST|nr:hypothetical protein PoB_004748200 [Plakobranchus ocellatus]